MKQIQPKKLKIMMLAFLGTGIWGIILGNMIVKFPFITILGVINLILGAIVGYLYLNPRSDKEKKH